MIHLPTFTATRYVQPLREGGTLPAVVETHGGGLYVTKFRGAGQGAKALLAELIVGMIAQALRLPIPGLALIELLPEFGQTEPDPEIQDLLKASVGINVGLRYLDGAFNFQPASAGDLVTPELAAGIVWLDAFTTNPDRTARNPNLLIHERRPWLIDHGAALYAQHNWPSVDEARTRTPFPLIKDHVLLAGSGDLDAADEQAAARLTDAVLAEIVAHLPEALLADRALAQDFATPDEARARYLDYLRTRMRAPRAFVAQAAEARETLRREPRPRLHSRR
ncbi:MAG TPA: HipA family kinase [Longimicrobium sp.]|nr:HipA family kinase [Longimicrobium sp.]